MKFALITEGASEHRIIRHILSKYFKDSDPEINQIQPKVINEKQETVGGWNEVLKYCERVEIKEILVENDYLVIQIDTDQSQTQPFDINHTKQDNTKKSPEELHADIVAKLSGIIRADIWETYHRKIFFAVCIHTIECWLLPLHSDHHKSGIRNCLPTLNTALRRKDMNIIPPNGKNEPIGIRAYENILKNWKRKQEIIDTAQYNEGFKRFVESLDLIPIEGIAPL